MNESAPVDDVWTVERILSWTTDYLAKCGVESARLESELLCAHARQCQRIRLYTDYDVPLTDAERARMRDYVQRRASREPLAYITGKREFYGRNFEVGAGILIPRPETETLIDLALEQIPEDRPSTYCEVGFGSGCIAITLAIQKPKCRIIAGDISEVCCEYAQRNALIHSIGNRIEFVHGNGLTALKPRSEDSLFDGLVSNPPYVCEHEVKALQPEVGRHEPRTSLVSGADGLDLIRRMIPDAAKMLKPGGWLGLECDPAQCSEIEGLLRNSRFLHVRTHRDHRNVDRIVTAVNGD
jgi:release factor glutamine methyltransferase